MKSVLVMVMLALAPACSDDAEGGAGGDLTDQDGDGYSVEDGDCNDSNRFIGPHAAEACDGVDNDCDGLVDEGYDEDGDGFTTCQGDCRDLDPNSYPGAREIPDGIDNDCDGIIDNNTTSYDDDGDGYSEDQGDCNDNDPLISPGAVEVQLDANGDPEGLDNDCDGIIDEALPPCPALSLDDPMAFAGALDACHFVTRAGWDESASIDARSRGVMADYGDTYVPRAGDTFAILSTGVVGDVRDQGYVDLSPGTDFGNTVPHPDPMGAIGCSDVDDPTVNDYSDLTLQLQVPANASAFSFDFNFMSAEYPEFVCTSFDDTFLAMLESQAFTGNVSFDAMGNRVSINVGFFTVCPVGSDPACTGDADLVGTGYEGSEGGGTGWLTTTAPVVPGEKIKLTFSIHDEGDHDWDSAVILDNFRWEVQEVDGPITVPMVVGPRSRFVTGADVVGAAAGGLGE
ncbi:MAG TPA: MopE-related protein [Kofleriaceae bacterium]|nr:MopE-related protein [Kofleriaceae bacterium]